MRKNAYLLAKIGADTAENKRTFAENFSKLAMDDLREQYEDEREGPPPPRPEADTVVFLFYRTVHVRAHAL